uniref:Uncharacterized protein n=1 Tax=Anguilla anguilla TaxID=7936 RepID=A0A0E9RFB8_ANGAN
MYLLLCIFLPKKHVLCPNQDCKVINIIWIKLAFTKH